MRTKESERAPQGLITVRGLALVAPPPLLFLRGRPPQATDDCAARVWDAPAGRVLAALPVGHHTRPVRVAVFSPHSGTASVHPQLALTASDDGAVRIWEAEEGYPTAALASGD